MKEIIGYGALYANISAILYIIGLFAYILYINYNIKSYLPIHKDDKKKLIIFRNILWTVSFSIIIHIIAYAQFIFPGLNLPIDFMTDIKAKINNNVTGLNPIVDLQFTIAHFVPYFILTYFIKEEYKHFKPDREITIKEKYNI